MKTLSYEKELSSIKELSTIIQTKKQQFYSLSTKEKKQLENAANDLQLLEIELQIKKDNAAILFYDYSMPKVLSVLKKYNGKSYGKKTAEKIRLELKNDFIGFYMNYNYSHCTVTLYPLDNSGYTDYRLKSIESIQYNNECILTDENKINVQDIQYKLYGYSNKTYIKNTRKAAEMILFAVNAVKVKEKELHDLLNAANDLMPVCCDTIISPYIKYPF